MALILNATQEDQTFKALGNWFTIKAGKTKYFEKQFSDFIAQERKHHGLVALPMEFFEEPGFADTEEGKAIMEHLREQAIDAYVSYHRGIIYNNQVSLKQDLERANLKIDPSILASDGEIESMKIVAKYQRMKDDKDDLKKKEVLDLMKQVGPIDKN